jgi:hypothetical protein
MTLRRSIAAVIATLAPQPLFAQQAVDSGARARHPEWVVWLALGILLMIFGFVAFLYLGGHQRKSSRSYGWWW